MQSLITTLNDWSAGWSQFMLAVLWQSTLLAAAVGAIAWMARRASPAVRYWLWQIVAIKLLLAPIWTLWLPLAWLPARDAKKTIADNSRLNSPIGGQQDRELATANPNAFDGSLDISFDGPGAFSQLPLASDPSDALSAPTARAPKNHARSTKIASIHWLSWLMIAWGALVACQALWLVWQRARLGRFLAKCPLAGEGLQQIVRSVAEPLQLLRVPTVRLAAVDCSPFVCGLTRPKLVLPRALESLVAAGELRPVIVHELAHLKRGDLWFGWLPQIARVVYFFHPVAHWAAFRVRLEAELACDGWAMSATGQGPAAYADLLVRIISRLSEPAMLRGASAGLDGQSSMESSVSQSNNKKEGSL
ncbi:MAG TPA: M56 family metallopeptidase [Pirellulales bacterium]|jgi:beta-lactamase regulating signal transducer with metallopeptidase domain